jgi:NADPH-dependent 2,4-dienoyl-CoA reductase/sulfur reductase-like enzyme
MGQHRLVVIGGDPAGMSAASQARQRLGPDELQVVAFERGRATSYSACGIPYWINGLVNAEHQLVSRSPEQHRQCGIDVRSRTEVVGIELAARTVRARDLDRGREYDEGFDSLVYATGSVPMCPPVPGIDAAGIYGVQTLDDGAALRAELDSGQVRRVVIVGGGYVGLEIAEACRIRGLDVTVVDRSATPVGTPRSGRSARSIPDAVRAMDIALILADDDARPFLQHRPVRIRQLDDERRRSGHRHEPPASTTKHGGPALPLAGTPANLHRCNSGRDH